MYGSPLGTASGGGVLYNKKIYADLGLKVPTTWDELMSNAEAVKAAGKIPVIQTYQDTWTSQLGNQLRRRWLACPGTRPRSTQASPAEQSSPPPSWHFESFDEPTGGMPTIILCAADRPRAGRY